ncbi:DUF1905 domain-containing protein [Naasia sp. SYSU D00057]|uniref:DUF1905 domain-containing protein n=1 Tax=Naasia sp. SYSU D00057 TaxID=2817380 RepID=UPI0027DBC643|nr:DUF1905 domain-containing protein [Naasia sp. SYSU D00057]
MPEPLTYEFTATLWPWEVRRDLWTLVTVPQEASEEIAEFADGPRRGFGAVRVRVRIGTAAWRTSVFPQSTGGPYVLPVKRAVREANGVDVGDEVTVSLEVLP